MSSTDEKDWKVFRSLQDELLNKVCEGIFQRVEQVAAARKGREHESYLELWKLIREEDKAVGLMFDDPRRSNFWLKIRTMRNRGVLTDEQVALFSPEMQQLTEPLQED